jgi:hypothetical protein
MNNKKDYILDDDKIRNCNSNIAKMNILEYIWFDLTIKGFFKTALQCILETGKEMFENTFYFIVNIVSLIFLPITLLIKAVKDINYSKKQVEKHRRMYGK